MVLVKPDGMEKRLVGQIIDRFERTRLKLVGLKLVQLTQPILDQWYAHHKDKSFFPELCQQMMSCPVVAMVWEGEAAVQKVFDICGPTDPAQAKPGTIRGDFGESKPKNVVHRSDTVETAQKETGLLFTAQEIFGKL